MKDDLIRLISFTEDEYNKFKDVVEQTPFDTFIDEIVHIVKENSGTIEDAIEMAESEFERLAVI
ncbi:hypothetical protein [Massilibacteroides sp.]|uniref:hypothetical protein n=1 Tax=Massilibacteroides sp. TaxID=2034766 RepID=UPI0026028BEA|nr:hypothetical protein [Massilibacteroides sp.]MDD4514548.1 hypothetical protein [Massilibacteroides sp.]